MKTSTSLAAAALLLPAATFALSVSVRQDDLEATTDTYLFDISLDQFIAYRNAQDPNTLNWESDGCTDSPDNPLGFNYQPACYRHDFGYTNYREQSRFTESAKDNIDDNFLADLKYQCDSETFESICDALAQVYYYAVKAFGGQDATPDKRASGGVDYAALYEEKLAVYKQLMAEMQAAANTNTTTEGSTVEQDDEGTITLPYFNQTSVVKRQSRGY